MTTLHPEPPSSPSASRQPLPRTIPHAIPREEMRTENQKPSGSWSEIVGDRASMSDIAEDSGDRLGNDRDAARVQLRDLRKCTAAISCSSYKPVTPDRAMALRALRTLTGVLSANRCVRELGWTRTKAVRELRHFAAKRLLEATRRGFVWVAEVIGGEEETGT